MTLTNNSDNLDLFIQELFDALQNQQWKKLGLSKYRGKEAELQRLAIRPISLRNETMLSFVYSYKTRDITKNFVPEEGLGIIADLLAVDFKAASFLTNNERVQLDISKKGKLLWSRQQLTNDVESAQETKDHNRSKKRFVDIDRPFLTALGVTDKQQKLIPSMSRKWKQINKFIEVFSQALESSPLSKDKGLQVVDFGSGKGYLTFAVHDYLRHQLHNQAQVTGVELRQALTDLCNRSAQNLDHDGLEFVCGDVKTHAPAHTDVMIALHACDTATDYAINYGIRANASIIMCSPCCHKQLRPQMQSPAVIKPMLQYGVHMGQQAEMVTDSLRALLLEAYGYSTKVFEFVSLEHTNKNKMILAVKSKGKADNGPIKQQIKDIKSFYGISEHCLETLLLKDFN
jgi:2-polyprenyl-3-methyl-5-hydroxy-6-metoxy-1,4-benzoquinol methylase